MTGGLKINPFLVRPLLKVNDRDKIRYEVFIASGKTDLQCFGLLSDSFP